MIKKEHLKDGMYYLGFCRNTYVAVWEAKDQTFYHLRYKFNWMKETIKHFEDTKESGFDGFVPIEEIQRVLPKEVDRIKQEIGY